MKSANLEVIDWDSFQYFACLAQHIAKALILQITKVHQGILLHYGIFQVEARITSLQASYSQMLLGITMKDQVLENAKKTHLIREKAIETYQTFLKLSNSDLQRFIKWIFPQISFSSAFDYPTFKTSLMNGSFGEIFYFQTDPIPLACPEIKKLSDDLD